MIGLSLAAILLTCLFSFFVESAKLEKQLETTREVIMARGNLQTRLQTIFTVSSSLYMQRFPGEKSESLVFQFDNQIDPDPSFSGTLLGRIYLDEQKNLNLVIWPLEQSERSWRKEVLFKGVDSFQFEFLGSDLKWLTSRGHTETQIPQMIRLALSTPEPLQFAFHLPTPKPFVTYLGGGA